jgi:hypothetical protein
MTAYFLFDPNGIAAFEGSFAQCCSLGEHLIDTGSYHLLKIARCRAGEDRAFICFEIEPGVFRQTPRDGVIDSKKLKHRARRTPLEVR